MLLLHSNASPDAYLILYWLLFTFVSAFHRPFPLIVSVDICYHLLAFNWLLLTFSWLAHHFDSRHLYCNETVSRISIVQRKPIIYASVITVVEFHSVADEIQLRFTSKWPSSKIFLTSWKTNWLRAVKNWGFSVLM